MANGQSNQQLQEDPLARLRRLRAEFDAEQEAERGADDPLERLKDLRAEFDAQQEVPGREMPPEPVTGIRFLGRTFQQPKMDPFGPVREVISGIRARGDAFVASRVAARDAAEAETGERPGAFRLPEGKMRDPFDPGRRLFGFGPRLPPRIMDIPRDGSTSVLDGPSLSEALGANQEVESIDTPRIPEARQPDAPREPESPEEKAQREEQEFQAQLRGVGRGMVGDQAMLSAEDVPEVPTGREALSAGVEAVKGFAGAVVSKTKQFGADIGEALREGTAAERQRRLDEGEVLGVSNETRFAEALEAASPEGRAAASAAEADAEAARRTSMEGGTFPPGPGTFRTRGPVTPGVAGVDRPLRPRRARGKEEVHAALTRALERDHAALQERYDSFPLPVRMVHSAVRGALNAPALGFIDDLVDKANGVVAATFGLDAPALTTAQVFEIVERGLLDKGAGGAGFLLGAGTVFGTTNRIVAQFAPWARHGTMSRTILDSFNPNNPTSVGVRALQGAVEGIPFDLLFKAENQQERMINLGLGLVLGAWLGPIVGGATLKPGQVAPDTRFFDPNTARGATREAPLITQGMRARGEGVPLAQQPLRQVLQDETARLEEGAARVKDADAPPARTLEDGPKEQPGPGFIGPEVRIDPESGLRVDANTGEVIESIASAAVRLPDGTVRRGPVHLATQLELVEEGLLRAPDPALDGFVTDAGRFVSRDEALRIAERTGQVVPDAERIRPAELGLGSDDVGNVQRGARATERPGSGRRVEDLEPNRIDELPPAPRDPEGVTLRERVTGQRNPSRDLDERTGLLNETAWERALERVQGPKDADGRLIDPSGSTDPNTEVLLFDLTRFKAINDLISMEAGNAKLREIANILRDYSGVSNRQIFRAGGDEFGIIIPAGTGEAIGRRIQEIVGLTPIADSKFEFGIRFGVGQSDVLANRAMKAAKDVEDAVRFRGAGGEALDPPPVRDPGAVEHTRTSADRVNPEVEVREVPTPDGPAGSPTVRPRNAADPPPPEVPVGRQADGEGGFYPLEEGAANARGSTAETVRELGPEAGALDPGAIRSAGRRIKGFFVRHFTTAGDLPQHIFRLKLKADQWVQAQMAQVKFMLRRYDDTLKDLYGEDGPSKEVREQVRQAMKGQIELDQLDPELAPIIKALREHIDSFSSQMMESGMVKGPMVGVIADNMGVYLSRSYRVFDPGSTWAQNVPKDVRNRAESIIRQERPDAPQEEIDGILEGLLDNQNTSPLAFLGGSGVGKDLSMLMRRKDIHPAIRAFMGEHTDVRLNYMRSVERMANTLATHEFLTEVARTSVGTPGRAGGFFFESRVKRGDERFISEFAATGSETMAPLNGLFTTPEIFKAFETAFSRQAQAPGWLNAYMKVNGVVKFDKTVLSLMTHVRNVLGNVGFAVANGHWRMQHLGRALEAANAGLGATQGARRLRAKVPVARDIGPIVKELTPETIARQERRLRLRESTGLMTPWERYYQNLVALGVVDQSAHGGELQAIIRDAARDGLDNLEPDGNLLARAAKMGLETAGNLYRAEDDLWKVIAFENEFARYRNAMPTASQAKVEETAAWIVRNTYPTYSMVPSGVRAFRRNLFVGSFTSFPAEVFRTMYHTISIAASEVRSPNAAIRKIGAERVAGIAAATMMVPAAVTASRFAVGVDKQQDKDLRHFVAPWQKNSQFIFLSKGDNAEFDFIDVSYTDPHSYARDAIMSFLTGDGDWGEKLLTSTFQFFQPFLGEEILFAKVADWRRNTTADGRKVFNEEDSLPDQAADIFKHFWDALEPGTMTAGRRIFRGLEEEEGEGGETSETGRVFDAEREIKAVLTGSRRQTTSVPQSLMFRSRATQARIRNADSILTRTALREGRVSERELTRDFWDSHRSRQRVFEESHEMALAAIRLGMTSVQVERALRAENISRVNARAIVQGTGPPRRRTDAGNPERNAILRSLEEAAERGVTEREFNDGG